MHVPKWLAIFGFHFCSTVFIGLSAYGVMRYMSEGMMRPDSLVAAGSFAGVILASIGGICFFGREADRRRAEEIRNAALAAPALPKKRKS